MLNKIVLIFLFILFLIPVTVCGATFTKQIAVTEDDGYFDLTDSSFNNSGIHIPCGHYYDGDETLKEFSGFFRFAGVTIPAGATITSASFTFYNRFVSFNGTHLRVFGNDADNPVAPTQFSDYVGLAKTTAYADWDIETSVPASSQTIPGLGSIIQEIVNREGWSSGNALMLVIEGNELATGWTDYIITPYDPAYGTAALVTIEYTVPVPPGGMMTLGVGF